MSVSAIQSSATARGTRHACFGVVLLIVGVCSLSCSSVFAWGAGHNDSSRLGASLAPEPFRSNPDLCLHAGYPDAIQVHAVGHGRDGYLRRLMTFEAIEALRAGDTAKGLFFASAATHYLTDRACIAHSGQAWYGPKAWQPLLAVKHRGVAVPSAKEEIYYEHLKGNYRDTVLKLPAPEYCRAIWDRTQGSTNAYFDSLPSVRRLVKPDMLRRLDNWTFTDAFLYGRWYAVFISLDMLAEASINAPPLRFRDPRGMTAVCMAELINGAAICASYYGYLATASATDVPADWAILPPRDRLLEWMVPGCEVLIAKDAPWAVERAALVLGMELARASRRRELLAGTSDPQQPVAPRSFVTRMDADAPASSANNGNLIVLVTPSDRELQTRFGVTAPGEGRRGRISVQANPLSAEHRAVVLAGASVHDTLYLVDYLLDLAWDPMHGRWPAEGVVAALQETWGGWKLIQDLRTMSGEAAVAHARKRPYRHQETRAADSKRYGELLPKNLRQGAAEVEWYEFFLLDAPLPDGRSATELLATGADYAEVLSVIPVTGKGEK